MTPAYEIRGGGKVLAGIPVADDGTIHVGEPGRGRELRRVAVPADRVEGGRLASLPGEGSVLLLIRDQSGHRGGWRVADYCPGGAPVYDASVDGWRQPSPCPVCGRAPEVAYRVEDRESSCQHVLRATPERRRGALDDPGVRVLAAGARAQGDAGRAGGGPEYLVSVPCGWTGYLSRWGSLYGGAPILRVRIAEDGSVEVSDPRLDPIDLSSL